MMAVSFPPTALCQRSLFRPTLGSLASLAALGCLLCAGAALAGAPSEEAGSAESSPPAAPLVDATVADLDFMAGCWQGPLGDEGFIRETYTAPTGGLMLGNSQVVFGGETQFFELIRLVDDENGLSYNPMPAGEPTVSFPVREVSATHATFENSSHDFPKTIVYRLEGATLIATIEGDGAEGKVRREEFRMSAVPCGGSAHRTALGARGSE